MNKRLLWVSYLILNWKTHSSHFLHVGRIFSTADFQMYWNYCTKYSETSMSRIDFIIPISSCYYLDSWIAIIYNFLRFYFYLVSFRFTFFFLNLHWVVTSSIFWISCFLFYNKAKLLFITHIIKIHNIVFLFPLSWSSSPLFILPDGALSLLFLPRYFVLWTSKNLASIKENCNGLCRAWNEKAQDLNANEQPPFVTRVLSIDAISNYLFFFHYNLFLVVTSSLWG